MGHIWKKLSVVAMSILFLNIVAPATAQQIDRSYLLYYPECDLSYQVTDDIFQGYLIYWGDYQTAVEMLLNDLYSAEIQCVDAAMQMESQLYADPYTSDPYISGQSSLDNEMEQRRQACNSREGFAWVDGLGCRDYRVLD
ncbi:hypothetical protein Lepto7375DRAFT_1003 [Leptolyngbya sp. PCC 7375]|nr:hypothetical protein Lepto7375DRAFT_1003 [Leptolyngbya sp. PCC 7375]